MATLSQRPPRQRPDMDVPKYERDMNDRSAYELYQQAWISAIRSDKDPNMSDEEEEFEGYIPPSFDAAKGRRIMEYETQRLRDCAKQRSEILSRLRNNKAHQNKKKFEQLMIESELLHGREEGTDGGAGKSATRRKVTGGDDDEADSDAPQCFITTTPSYIKGTLRSYQVEGVNWLLGLFNKNINGILADEMGLGKTFQTIATLAYLKFTYGLPGPHLVVVPKSVLGNWIREFKRWCPALRVYKFHSGSDIRQGLIKMHLTHPIRYDVIVTTFDMVLFERTAFTRIHWNYLIVDEAHKLKNNESSAHMVLDKLRTCHRLLITGTPLQNNLGELWALLHFLAPLLFPNIDTFQQWFDISSGTQDEQAVSYMHLVLNPMMLRRLKSDVNTGIPPKKEIYVTCQLSHTQRKWYLGVLTKDADALNKASGGSVAQLNNVLIQLRKVCNHPYLMPGAEPGPPFITDEKLIKSSGKMVLLDKLLAKLFADKEANHKVLIFSQMTRMLDILEDYLIFRGYGYCRIDGSTNGIERDAQMAEFNNVASVKKIFLLSTRAGGLGINLQAANNVVLYDSDWNPQADLQAQDRAHRIGQKRSVRVYRFITTDTVEQRIYERALKKLYLDAMVVQQGRIRSLAQTTKTSKDELLSMVKFGANTIFENRHLDVTDEDIDKLISQGEETMNKLQEEAKSTSQASLASFKFGADQSNLYDFEGVSYKSGTETKMLHITLSEPISQDELVAICGKYGEVIRAVLHPNLKEALVSFRSQEGATDCLRQSGLSCTFAARKAETTVTAEMMELCAMPGEEKLGRGHRHAALYASVQQPEKDDSAHEKVSIKLPKRPQFPIYQLYNMPRLLHLHEAECAMITRNHRRLNKSIADGTPYEEERLTQAEIEEKEKLLAEGFDDWTIGDYNLFRSAVTSGKTELRDYAKISELMGGVKTEGQIKDYVAAFLERGPALIPRFEAFESRIRRAEEKLQTRRNLLLAARWKMESCAQANEELRFARSKDGDLEKKLFLAVVDNNMSFAAALTVRNYPEYKYDIFIRTRPNAFFESRLRGVMSGVRKEWERATGVIAPPKKRGRTEKASSPATEEPASTTATTTPAITEPPHSPDLHEDEMQ